MRFPASEALRIRNPYWSLALPENLKEVFDDHGQPKVAVIIACEREWLGNFEAHCDRIFAIQPKTGVSRKMVALIPAENASAPTKSWLKKAAETLDDADLREIVERIRNETPRNPAGDMHLMAFDRVTYQTLENKVLEFKAMAWAAHLGGAAAAEPLYDFALRNYAKIPGVGPKNAKLANAAAMSLSLIEGGVGVPYLLDLEKRVKYPKIKELLNQRIAEVSLRQGQSKQDMEELTAPDHGFE